MKQPRVTKVEAAQIYADWCAHACQMVRGSLPNARWPLLRLRSGHVAFAEATGCGVRVMAQGANGHWLDMPYNAIGGDDWAELESITDWPEV